MDFAQAVAKIYDRLESNDLEGAVMACLRVARGSNDHFNAVVFLRELFPHKEEVARMLYDDARSLSEEALKYIWERSLDRWLEVHQMDFEFPSDRPRARSEGDKLSILKVGVGEIDSEIRQWEATIQDMTPPTGMSPFDTAAFASAAAEQKSTIRLRLNALNTIRSRLKTRCFNYALQIERQLALQDRNTSVLWNVQNEVNNYFKERASEVFEKLQKASELASAKGGEDAALLLTEVRRALKSAADHFYPASVAPVLCSDGKERVLGEEQYMNRLEEFLGASLRASTAKDLAIAELRLLATFMRRLNDLASKGVHASVPMHEARQGLVGLYMFLFTVCQHLASRESSSTGN